MKISKANFLALISLIENKSITASKLKNKALVEALQANGAIKYKKTFAKRATMHLLKEENIFLLLKNHSYNISTKEQINQYINEFFKKEIPRDELQKWRGDTKVKDSKAFLGLYINAFEKLELTLALEPFFFTPTYGTSQFLFHTQKLEVSNDVTIVGVENYQVLWFIQDYSYLFKEKKLLFVMINPFMLEWIQTQTNEYIHFGDYDIAGIGIYYNKMIPRLQNAKKYSMLIPEDIEKHIKNSTNFKLYEEQKHLLNIQIKDDDIQILYDLLKKYRVGFEQEGLRKRNLQKEISKED